MLCSTTNRLLPHRPLPPVSFAALCMLLVALVSCGGSASTTPTPTPVTIQFVTFNLGIPAQALNAPVVGPLPDNTRMHVVATFKANQALLNQLNKQKVKPGQSTDLKNLANQIGISDATYQKIKTFFGIEGASLKLSDLHTTLAIDAQAATFARLLRIKFVTHQLNGRKFYTPSTSPTLPKFVADTLVAITGLDNYSPPPRLQAVAGRAGTTRIASGKHTQQDCSPNLTAIGPVAVAHAYGYDQLNNRGWHGENLTVNLVEIDGFNTNDIQNYFDCVKYTGKFQAVNVDTSVSPQPAGENTLDIDMVAGLAHAANIVDYETLFDPNADIWTQVNDELQQILNDNMNNTASGDVVSISLGTDERQFTSSDLASIDQSLQELTQAEHMTVFVSSGDCGAYTSGIPNDLSVSFPASDPWATAVGGTVLTVDGNLNRSDEVVWSDASDPSQCRHQTDQGSEWGSGGGVSRVFQAPAWEKGNGVNNRFTNGDRQLPDVSAAASNLLVYYQNGWTAFDGTSAATPIWAAGFVLLNEGVIQTKQIFFYGPDTFYGVANSRGNLQPYFDVITGNNVYYSATPGWDDASGWGTPNLGAFFQVLLNLAG